MDRDDVAVLGERSSAACAVASWRGEVHLAWTGSDRHLNVMTSPDGRHFSGKRTLPHRSYTTATERRGGGAGVSDSRTTTRVVPLAPALAATAGGVHLGWTGTDRRLNVAGPAAGPAGHLVLPERSSHAPALGAWAGGLVVAWTGTDRHLNVLRGGDGGWGRPLRLDETSAHAPALGAWAGGLVVAWTGTDRHLNLLALGPEPGVPVRLPARSSHAPALCAHLGDLVVAWTGTDRRLDVARLPAPA